MNHRDPSFCLRPGFRFPARKCNAWRAGLLGACLLAAVSPSGRAVDASWNGTTDGTWATGSNWSATPIPGNANIATFNNAGNGNTTINLAGASLPIGSVRFDLATAAPYTIGSSVGDGTLTSSTGIGAVNMTNVVVNNEEIDSNLVMGSVSPSFINAALTNLLTIKGSVSGGNASASILTLTGPGTGTISGTISNGASAAFGVTAISGTWTLSSPSSTFSGSTITVDGVAYTRSVQLTSGAILAVGADSTGGSPNTVAPVTAGPLGTGALILGPNTTWTVEAAGSGHTIGNTVVVNNTSGTFGGTNSLALNGLFVFGGGNIITSSISGAGNALNIGGDVHIRETGATARIVTFNGTGTTVITGAVSNGASGATGSVAYSGTGTLKLSGADTYTGTTSVSSGTLLVDGSHTSATVGAYTINGTGLLGGTGTLTPSSTNTVALSGTATLAPGDGTLAAAAQTGTLDIGSKLTFATGTALALQLGGATPGDGAGFYDQVNVTNTTVGAITLTGAVTLNLSLVNGFVPAGGDVFYVLTRGDNGAFATLFSGAAEGGTISFSGGTAQITYVANWTGTEVGSSLTGGNDVALYNVVAVPEPGSPLLLGIAGTAGLLMWRRRSRAVSVRRI